MDSSARPLDSLRVFRNSLYRCFDRRADALFELTDALLTAGPVPSPPHLSLAAAHRRGWGSLYAALSMGRTDEAGLRELLSRHAPRGWRPGLSPGLRRGRELGGAAMRRGGEPGAGVLLPPVEALGRAAYRGRLGIPAGGTARL